MTDNNKGIKSLWGYPLIDSKARNAISDTRSSLENKYQKKTDDTLTTTNKTIVGSINEVNTQCKDIVDKKIDNVALSDNRLTFLANNKNIKTITLPSTTGGTSDDTIKTISSKVLATVPASSIKLDNGITVNNISINKDRRYYIEFLGSKKLCSLLVSEEDGNYIICSIGGYLIEVFTKSTNVTLFIYKINKDDTTIDTFTDLVIYEEEVKYLDSKYIENDLVLQNSISLGRKGDIGEGSSAIGIEVEASGMSSHAEGGSTTASSECSHAEGLMTTASGMSSHAEGGSTTASGECSHAEGEATIASGECQHVQGKYNIEDNNNKYAHIVGNGDPTTRANAHTLDWQGNAWYAGKLSQEGTPTEDKDLVTKKYVDNIKTDIDSIKTELGTETLNTTAQNVKGAVNEVAAQCKDIASKTIIEGNKIYLEKSDGTKLDEGTTLPVPDVCKSYSYIIAPNDAPETVKKGADYVCTGTNDQIIINEAIQSLEIGDIYLAIGNFNITAQIELKDNVNILSNGAIINKSNEYSSLLTQDANVNDTIIYVKDASGFLAGQKVIVCSEKAYTDPGPTGKIISVDYKNNTITLNYKIANGVAVSASSKVVADYCCVVGNKIKNVKLQGLRINGNKANNPTCVDTNYAQNGIQLNNCNMCLVENCIVHNISLHGILFINTTNSIIRDCHSNTCGRHGIDIYGSPSTMNILISNCICNSNATGGIQCHNGSGVSIIGCSCSKNEHGIMCQEGANNNVINACILNNNSFNGIRIVSSSYINVVGNTLTGNYEAIQFDGTSKSSICNNTINKNSNNAIGLYSAKYNNIDNNNIHDNNKASSYSKIRMEGACTHNKITNNYIANTESGYAATDGIAESSSSNYNIIINNIFKGNTNGVVKVGTNSVDANNYNLD